MSDHLVKILLIEDNSGDVLLLTEMLVECTGYFDVKRANRISAALELVKQHQFQVIIMDLNLPDSSAIDSLKRIRAGTSLPIIVLSGSVQGEVAEMSAEYGIVAFFTKGKVEVGELCAAIEVSLGQTDKAGLP